MPNGYGISSTRFYEMNPGLKEERVNFQKPANYDPNKYLNKPTKRRNRGGRDDDQADYIPSPQEIRDGCTKIQKTWSPRERRRRSFYKPLPVETLEVAVPMDVMDRVLNNFYD